MKFYYFNLFVGIFIALQILTGMTPSVPYTFLLLALCILNLFIAYLGFKRDNKTNQEKKYKDFKDPKDYF